MNRKSLLAFPAAIAIAAAVFTGPAAAKPAPVEAEIGPGPAVGLTIGGKKVSLLKRGVPYRFQVTDHSTINDLRIVGPGIDRVVRPAWYTGTGTVTVTLTLEKGTYRYLSTGAPGPYKYRFTVS